MPGTCPRAYPFSLATQGFRIDLPEDLSLQVREAARLAGITPDRLIELAIRRDLANRILNDLEQTGEPVHLPDDEVLAMVYAERDAARRARV